MKNPQDILVKLEHLLHVFHLTKVTLHIEAQNIITGPPNQFLSRDIASRGNNQARIVTFKN